jgi:hypothetical protein
MVRIFSCLRAAVSHIEGRQKLTALVDLIVEGRQDRYLFGLSAPLALSTRPVKSGKPPRTPEYRQG